jgi:hypothetical protein
MRHTVEQIQSAAAAVEAAHKVLEDIGETQEKWNEALAQVLSMSEEVIQELQDDFDLDSSLDELLSDIRLPEARSGRRELEEIQVTNQDASFSGQQETDTLSNSPSVGRSQETRRDNARDTESENTRDLKPEKPRDTKSENTRNTESERPLVKFQDDLSKVVDRLEMPRTEISPFDGNLLMYREFLLNFQETIGNRSVSKEMKLRHLVGLCKGKAYDAIRPCLLMDDGEGFQKALDILERRFGNSFTIARANIKALTQAPSLRADDSLGLLAFSDKVQACVLTLMSLGRTTEIDSQESMVKISEKLPQHLQT